MDNEPEVTPQAALAVTPASVIPSTAALLRDCLALEAIVQGQPVYFVDAQFMLASAAGQMTVKLADATTNYKVEGIAATSAAAGQPIKIIVSDPALAMGGVAIGDVVYLGVGVGTLTITYADLVTGKVVQVLGVGVAVGKINMKILRSDTVK